MIDVSIVIITYNRIQKVYRLIQSVFDSNLDGINYEIIVVDDCSPDGTYQLLGEQLKSKKNVTLLRNSVNSKVSYSRNRGIKIAKGEFIFCIDDDVVLTKDAIREMVKTKRNLGKTKTVLAPIMFDYQNQNKIWFSGIKLNFWLTTGRFLYKDMLYSEISNLSEFIPTDAILTAFLMSKKDLEEIGCFDEELFPFQFEEIDFFVRSGYLGFKLFVIPQARIYHDHEHGVFLQTPWRLELVARNRLLTAKLWSKNITQQYSAVLSALLINFSYFILKLFFFREKQKECYRSLTKGIISGMSMLETITPYRKVFKNSHPFKD